MRRGMDREPREFDILLQEAQIARNNSARLRRMLQLHRAEHTMAVEPRQVRSANDAAD